MVSKKIAVLFLSALVSVPVPAATVSFLIVETGLPPGADANEHSSLWESGLFDVFFDAGHIVSNAPILRLEGKFEKELPETARADIDEAAQGGMDYFIIAVLDYPLAEISETETAAVRPDQVSLKLFTTSPCRLLFEQRCGKKQLTSMDDEFLWVKQEVRRLLPQLNDPQ
ncbi:MAG: hypothetical protein LBD71_07850 [Treponema sp.]|jgi:hypothetical protein|nr:hypothetical protein [Treponema sp.]